MKRSCQRQTQVFDLPVRRMISLVPIPSALNRTISARQTCLCGVLRSPASAFRRRRSSGLRVIEIPVRMRQTRMPSSSGESPPGFKCQTRSTLMIADNGLWHMKWPADCDRRQRHLYDGYAAKVSAYKAAADKLAAQAAAKAAAVTAACPGNPTALGTSRVLAVSGSEFVRVGTMQYAHTLPLADHEVVLTFDDGPLPPYTDRVLAILAAECVKATYFMVGSMANAYPDAVRQVYN